MNSNLIDFGNHQEIPFIDLFDEMLDFVDDVVEPLGSEKISRLSEKYGKEWYKFR